MTNVYPMTSYNMICEVYILKCVCCVLYCFSSTFHGFEIKSCKDTSSAYIEGFFYIYPSAFVLFPILAMISTKENLMVCEEVFKMNIIWHDFKKKAILAD